MRNNDTVERGALLLLNTREGMFFDPGDEFNPCIWVSGGSIVKRERDFDDYSINEYTDAQAINIMTDMPCDYGMHMFMTVYQFYREYDRITYMLKDDLYRKKLEGDIKKFDRLHRMKDIKCIQIINTIIANARMILDFGPARDAASLLTEKTMEEIKKISELKKFDMVPSPSEIERINEMIREKKKEEKEGES